MNERLTRCPKCGKVETEVVRIHNPETLDMNAQATLRCKGCGETWDGRVTSPVYEKLRQKGIIL